MRWWELSPGNRVDPLLLHGVDYDLGVELEAVNGQLHLHEVILLLEALSEPPEVPDHLPPLALQGAVLLVTVVLDGEGLPALHARGQS